MYPGGGGGGWYRGGAGYVDPTSAAHIAGGCCEGGGGGGCCSKNCYPLYCSDMNNSRNTGNGGVWAYRISSSEPSHSLDSNGTLSIGNGTYTTPQSYVDAWNGSAVTTGLCTGFVYRYKYRNTSNWNNDWDKLTWSEWSTNKPSVTIGVGEIKVQCCYVLYADSTLVSKIGPCYNMRYTKALDVVNAYNGNGDSGYTINSWEWTLENHSSFSNYEPTAKTNLMYNGEPQVLANKNSRWGMGHLGDLRYRLGDNGEWCEDINDERMKATNAGDYVIYYKIDSLYPTLYPSIGNTALNVKIKKCNTGLTLAKGTLLGVNKLWNGKSQTGLFSGEGVIKKGQYSVNWGTIYYRLKNDKNEYVGSEKSDPGLLGATEPGNYTLYYKLDGTDNYDGVDWMSSGVTAKITANEIEIDFTKNSNVKFDGEEKQLLSSLKAKIKNEATEITNITDYASFTFTVNHKLLSGELHEYTIDGFSASNITGKLVGNYTLTVSWDTNNISKIKSGSQTLITNASPFKIEKPDATEDSDVKISGITPKNVNLGVDGKAIPFEMGNLNITVNNISEYQQISNNYNDYNKVKFAISQNGSATSVSDIDNWSSDYYTDNNTLKNKINESTVSVSGSWYLYLLFVEHNTIVEDKIVKIGPASVSKFSIGDYITVNVKENNNNNLIYNGRDLTLADNLKFNSTISGKYDLTDLGTVTFITNKNKDNIGISKVKEAGSLDGWKVKDAGTYYVWLTWDGGAKVAAGSRRFGTDKGITIKKVDQEQSMYFEGISFNGDNTANANVYTKNYFKNAPYTIIANENEPVIRVHVSQGAGYDDLTDDFGTFNIAIGNDAVTEPEDQNFVAVSNYTDGKMQKKDKGNYYVWIKWSGGNNVSPGKHVYCIEGLVKPYFKIDPLTDANAVVIEQEVTSEDKILSYDSDLDCYNPKHSKYKSGYTWGMVHINEQQLFTATEPVIKINGAVFESEEVDISYSLNSYASGVESISGLRWVDSVDGAMQANAGTYYLWRKTVFRGDNVNNITKYERLGEATKITKANGGLVWGPTARNLSYNGWEQVLINAVQVYPQLEYRVLQKKMVDGVEECTEVGIGSWTTDISEITGDIDATYEVYYRVAGDDNFNRQDYVFYGESGLKAYVSVEIGFRYASMTDNDVPLVKEDLCYTGKALQWSDYMVRNGEIPVDELDGNNLSVTNRFPLYYRTSYLELRNDKDEYGNYNWYSAGDSQLTLPATAGVSYKLYYKPSTAVVGFDEERSFITITVGKAKLEIINQPASRTLTYSTCDYNVFFGELDYVMIDYAGNRIQDNSGNDISYSRYGNGVVYGQMRAIKYGYSQSTSLGSVDVWYDSFDDANLAIVNSGTYYPWVGIPDGANYEGDVFCLENSAITINPAGIGDLDLSAAFNINLENGGFIHFDGTEHKLIAEDNYAHPENNFALVVKVKKRRNNNEEQGEYDDAQNYGGQYGTWYYALSLNSQVAPSLSSGDWKEHYKDLTGMNAGDYYLWVRYVSVNGMDSNLANLAPVCIPVEIRNATSLKIDTVNPDKINFEGYTGNVRMYTGKSLTNDLLEFANDLNVKVGNYLLNSDFNTRKYLLCRVNMIPENPVWTDLDGLDDIVDAGVYQLYVKFSGCSGNIAEDLIVGVFKDGFCPEITKANESYIEMINPKLKMGLTYKGIPQCLLETVASVQMKMNNASLGTLGGNLGTPHYCISGRSDMMTIDGISGTENEFINIEDVKQIVAKSYYIWVMIEAGDNHAELSWRCVGEVIIGTATADDIALRGIVVSDFSDVMYNGNEQKLFNDIINSRIVANFVGGADLIENTDYTNISYACSRDDKNHPNNPSAWKTNLSDLMAKDAGVYYIWVHIEGINNVGDVYKCYDADWTMINRADLSGMEYLSNLREHVGLSYIGVEQEIADLYCNNEQGNKKLVIKIGTAVDVNLLPENKIGETDENDNVYWGLSTSDAQPTEWKNKLSDVKATDAGTYYLWIKVVDCNNIYDVPCICCQIVIDPAIFEFGEPVCGDLIYTGREQSLISGAPNVVFKPRENGRLNPGLAAIYYPQESYEVPYSIKQKIQYSLNGNDWYLDYNDVQLQKTNANVNGYEVYYGILADDTHNWDNSIAPVFRAVINPKDASLELERNPEAIARLVYNKEGQDLINFGSFIQMPEGYGSAKMQGAKIVFWYGDNEEDKYSYYYNGSEYVWSDRDGDGEGDKLPQRTDAGDYVVKYYVSGTSSENYRQSEIKTIADVKIEKCPVQWEWLPKPVSNLEYNGTYQKLLNEGRLSVDGGSEVTVMYTTADPAAGHWQDTIPMGKATGGYDIYFYVRVSNNYRFVGNDLVSEAENNENQGTAMGRPIQVSIESFVLEIYNPPMSGELSYNGEFQDLIQFQLLSSDSSHEVSFTEEDKPYFEYTFTPENPASWVSNIQAKDCGTYTVYYRVHYDTSVFTFSGNYSEEGVVTATITGYSITADSIRAVYNETTNEVEVEIEEDLYTDTLKNEFLEHVRLEYRLCDAYNPNETWQQWKNGQTTLPVGTYQFRAVIEQVGYGNLNEEYTQQGIVEPYDEYEKVEMRKVYIKMPEDTYRSRDIEVRVWIDFDGTKLNDFDKVPVEYKFQGKVKESDDQWLCRFSINSLGTNATSTGGDARLRIEVIDAGYYYISTSEISEADREEQSVPTDWKNRNNSLKLSDNNLDINIWLYEIYRIQYNANGANGTVPAEGWKWHGINYKLAENTCTKDDLKANGWSTARVGKGTTYANGDYYFKNMSQTFYASFFTDISYLIDWIITDGTTTYRWQRGKNTWFNPNHPDKLGNKYLDTGIYYAQGDRILLPQITQDEDGKLLWSGNLFGNKYIKGWHIAKPGWDLSRGIEGNDWYEDKDLLDLRADRDYTFVAILVDRIGNGNGIQCVFKDGVKDGAGNEIVKSGILANGANSYMALSGMNAATIETYQTGYDKWVAEHKGKNLYSSTQNGIIPFYLGNAVANPEASSAHTTGSYVALGIMVVLGVAGSVGSLVAYYIVVRKKKLKLR